MNQDLKARYYFFTEIAHIPSHASASGQNTDVDAIFATQTDTPRNDEDVESTIDAYQESLMPSSSAQPLHVDGPDPLARLDAMEIDIDSPISLSSASDADMDDFEFSLPKPVVSAAVIQQQLMEQQLQVIQRQIEAEKDPSSEYWKPFEQTCVGRGLLAILEGRDLFAS